MKIFYKTFLRLNLAMILASVPAFSLVTDTIFFSIPKVNAYRGDTVRIPINISAVQVSDSVFSGDIQLSFDTTVIQILSVQTDTTLLAGSPSSFNPVLRKIGFASSFPIAGSGPLLKLVARLLPTATSSSMINFVTVQLNEQNLNIVTTNGELNPLNQLPQFVNLLKDTSVIEQDSIMISFEAFDPDGDPVKYSLGSPIKDISGVFFDTLSGTFAWRPNLFQGGIGYLLHVTATDDRGGFSIVNINLTVNNLNQKPQIFAFPDTIFRQENGLINDTVAASDADFDLLTFSLQNAPAGMTITPVGSNQNIFRAVLSWVPGFNQAGTYPVTLVVNDNIGGINTKGIIVRISDVNRFPVFTTPPRDTVITENVLMTMPVKAVDDDNDEIIYGLNGAPDGMTIDQFSGVISWTPNFTQAGTHNFEVGAGDQKGLPAKAAVTFTVLNVNRAPQFMAVLPDTIIYDTTTLSFKYSAFDPDNDGLSFFLIDQPPGASIGPFGNFNYRPEPNQFGIKRIVVHVTDGSTTVVDTAQVLVLQSNNSPFFTKGLPDTTINVGKKLTFQYSASDPDSSDPLSFGLFFGPPGVNVSPQGVLNWIPNSTGQNLIIVGVTDGKGGTLDTAFVTVKDAVNRPPQFIAALPDIFFPVDSMLNFRYAAEDPDNDNLLFSFVKFPLGAVMQLDGTFSWRPTASQVGQDTIIVAVSDGFLITVDTAVVTVFGSAAANVSQTNFDFGSINFGGSKTLSATITNTGTTPLMMFAMTEFNLKPDPNFVLDTSSGISIIAPGVQKTISITYHPKSVGGHFTAYVFITNDIKNPSIVLTANGSAIAKLAVTKKLLVDTLHGSPLSFNDSINGITQLFKFFEQSGIQVSLTGSDLRPSGNDILLMIAPQKKFTRQEIDSVKSFVTSGGLLIALGNSAVEGNNASALNSLLQDTTWTTGLALDSNLVVDSSSFYGNAIVPLLTTFADAKHPYFTNVDTLVFFGSAGVTVSGTAVPLITTTANGRTLGGQSRTQPAVAGLSKIGKGKILLLGDADVWNVEYSNQQNGEPNNGEQTGPNISVKDNLAFAINVFSVTEDYEVKLPNKTPNERYQLVSIPFDLENADVASVLQGLGERNPLVWRLFGHYDPSIGKYAEFPSDNFTSFKRGEAYWLITRGEFGLSLGNSTIVPVQSFYPIKIGPGYSMVGNPFPYKVSWKNSLHDSTQSLIWKFDGESFKAESLALDPFAGYFVKNLSKDSITIYINPEDITGLKKTGNAAGLFADGEWKIGLGAVSGKSADEENFAGVAIGAKDEFDRYDAAEPPSSPTDYVIVRFQNSSWKEQSGSYAMDIRSINSEGLFWDFNVITAKSQSRVTLNVNQLGNIPPDFEIYIVDKTTERVLRIDRTYQYEFSMSKNESLRNFRLIAGKKEFVENNTQGIPLVAVEYSLLQNYPNPFNPSTQIRYVLGHSGHVSLDVYNVLGQHIRSLTNVSQPIGTYELEWDGKDNSGLPVSTGVYFYKLTVRSNGENIFTETKKLMMLK